MNTKHLGEFRVQSVRRTDWPMANTPAAVARYWREHVQTAPWYDEDKECLVGITLSTRTRITGHYLIGLGRLDRIDTHAREVFRPAIVAAAHRIILAHNHPSGDPTPSQGDICATRHMESQGRMLDVLIEDHVIIGVGGFASLRDLKYMP